MRIVLKVLFFAVAVCAVARADDFDGASWIGEDSASALPRRQAQIGEGCKRLQRDTCPLFRKTFDLGAAHVASATAYVTGLGFYDLTVNGVSPDPMRMMTPAWTCPDWRVYYETYDVTALLRTGANEIAVQLASGYDDDVCRWTWRWLHAKRLICAVEVRLTDGTSRRIVSDGSWQWTAQGPRVSASLYHGETYDATVDVAQAKWSPVKVVPAEGLNLVRNTSPAVRRYEPRKPVGIRHCGNGRHILDFGVNRAAVTELRVKAPRGTRITMRHAEELQDDALDTRTQRTARQADVYVTRGSGETERYVPRFTYHGYRYVEVSGLPDDAVTTNAFVSWGVSADVSERAMFSCSDETLNWLWDAARRSMRSNFMTYPTDCCMRTERTPCLMDSQVYEDAAFQIYDMSSYYSKWLFDAVRYERVVDPRVCDNNNPDWAGEPFFLAERFLTYCAATNVALREYGELKRQADWFAAHSADGLWQQGFGDWCSAFGFKRAMDSSAFSPALVNSLLLHEVYRIMARLAVLKGAHDETAHYEALRQRTQMAFLSKFYDARAKRFGKGLAVEQILPLKFGLVPAEAKADVVRALAERIRTEDKGHLFVGIYGSRYAGDVLLDAGLGDVWLDGVRTPEGPSFGFLRQSGATSLWEQWTRDGSMHSHNHAMFAGVTSCFLTHLAGIRPAADGYARLLIKPCFPKGLNHVCATVQTPVGRVGVTWRRVGARVDYCLSLPPNVPYDLQLPPEADLNLVSEAPTVRLAVFADHIARHAALSHMPVSESAAAFRALGYEGFDAHWNADKTLLDAAIGAGLTPACFYGGIPFAKAEARVMMEGFLARAKAYGVSRIMVVPQYSRKDASLQATEFTAIVQGLREMTERANEAGIIATTEDVGLPWSPCAKFSNVRRMLAAVPALKFTLDTGNLEHSDLTRNPCEALHETMARLRHVHLKDRIGSGDASRPVALGEGDVPNVRLVSTLREKGYSGWFTVEHFSPTDDPYELCRRSARWCATQLGK